MTALFLQKGLERYQLLVDDVAKLPTSNEVAMLQAMIGQLQPFVLDGATELDTSSFHIEVSNAIVKNHSVPSSRPGFNRVTKLGKQLQKVAAGVNAICTFTGEEGDELIDDIQQQLIVVAEALQ